MKAVGLYKYLPIEDPQSLVDLDIPRPNHPTTGHDLLVAIKAVSINPVDTKVRRGLIPITVQIEKNIPSILGWDAAGKVVEAGSDCTLFKKGDAVYYAGSISRPLGTNCEYHLVDERIVGRKPKSLSFEEAAAMPLTTITAWEALYDRLSLYQDVVREKTADTSHATMPTDAPYISNNKRNEHQSYILIIGGAGGVGSIAIQLAKNLVNQSSFPSSPSTASSSSIPGPNVVATASRTESVEWCKRMGADFVVNHHKDLKSQIKEVIGIDYVDYILCLNETDGHFESMKQLVAPQGKICSIVVTKGPVDLGGVLQQKSATFVWELMFTRSLFQTPDMISQHYLLNTVADLIDNNKIKSTLTDVLSPINAENMRKGHRKLESGTTIGKIVLSGF
ncbi:MAG TPA: zinc-binding alcohol dehydrogenase family protein [Methylomirabilota bacterium]|nr:zinc-binding alcohol dehydrogenase family protein [Methylomirabilota bacterium]